MQSGTFPVIISAINSGGAGSAVLSLAMTPPPPVPVITSASTLSGTAGVAIATYQITANGGPTSYGSSGLPSGLSTSASSGKITGTPKYPGTYNATIIANNAGVNGAQPLEMFVRVVEEELARVAGARKGRTD